MIFPGIDLVKISRIEKALETKRFRGRCFGERELAEQALRGDRAEGFAACFAAKEAFSKAIGTGVRGFSLRQVELLHGENGAPYLHLSGEAAEIAECRGLRLSVSITHECEYAAAFVICEETRDSE